MCTYIAATVPGDANIAAVATLAEAHGLGWEAFPNRHLLTQVGSGSSWFLTTRKHCDCGTALGAAGSEAPNRTHDPQSDVPKLRQRGWSEQKIARWLAEKGDAEARRERARLSRADSSTSEVDSWLRFLDAALRCRATHSIGILLHYYSGLITGERITIKRRDSTRLADLTSLQLCEMEADVLYNFTS
jgi:hypothetical protein